MKRTIINPWHWQDSFGFVQANHIGDHQRMLLCAGQTAMDAQGNPVHAGDMQAQIIYALDNLQTVLAQADMRLSNVMQLKYFTTDIDQFFSCYDVLTARLEQADCQPASTLLGVQALAFPELVIEIEAMAVA